MIPRGAPYIGWADLVAATCYSVAPREPALAWSEAQSRVEALWAPNTVAFLSVRSGLDALFAEFAFPRGSEIVTSAITIPNILDIIAHHGLVAVPVDVDPDTLAVDAAAVRRAITPATKAILIAHLFGSRMPLDGIAAVARDSRIPLLEDCAQSNDGTAYRGHAGSAVSMFSFGSIKRQTAMGGGLLVCHDAALAGHLRARQATYPVVARTAYFRRVATMIGIKAAAVRPIFNLFEGMCRLLGRDHDRILGNALRGFSHGDLFVRLRQQPCIPMLRLLDRRLRQPPLAAVAARVAVVRAVTAEFPDIPRGGAKASHHSHWLFPILVPRPAALMHQLGRSGFDATRGASNLCCVPAPAGRTAPRSAQRLMDQVLYLPLCTTASPEEMRLMARVVRAYEAAP